LVCWKKDGALLGSEICDHGNAKKGLLWLLSGTGAEKILAAGCNDTIAACDEMT